MMPICTGGDMTVAMCDTAVPSSPSCYQRVMQNMSSRSNEQRPPNDSTPVGGVGLGLNGGAMVFAGLGLIPPIAGALLQEGIDVAVIVTRRGRAR